VVAICGRCLETPIREKDHDTDDRKKTKEKEKENVVPFVITSA